MSIPIALELYSVRDSYRTNFAECLKKTSEIGYAGVECFGAPTLPALQVRDALQSHKLVLVGWHTPLELLQEDRFGETVEYFHTVGNTRAIIPWVSPDTFATKESTLSFASSLNLLSSKLAPEGIALGYHNHDAEFIPFFDDSLPWSLLMDNTEIIAQLDNGNALSSRTPNLDTAKLVSMWPRRAKTVHAKPYARQSGFATMIGEDDIDWRAFLSAAKDPGGAEWIIVEYEEESMFGQFEGAKKCLHALKKFM